MSHLRPSENELAFITNFDLEPGHTFLEMITNVIHFYSDTSLSRRGTKAAREANIYPDGDIKKAFPPELGPNPHEDYGQLAATWASRWADLMHYSEISLEMHEPAPSADVILSTSISGPLPFIRRDDIKVHYYPPTVFNKEAPHLPETTRGDLSRTCKVSGSTLRRLGLLLREDCPFIDGDQT
jgi:hypothetical protein